MMDKVLVVEDDAVLAENLCECIELLGYATFQPANSYEEALKAIHEFSPDVIVLDINLKGGKSGVDIAKYINEGIHTPFIYLTGNISDEVIHEARLTNPSSFLVKPFDVKQMKASLQIAISNQYKDPRAGRVTIEG